LRQRSGNYSLKRNHPISLELVRHRGAKSQHSYPDTPAKVTSKDGHLKVVCSVCTEAKTAATSFERVSTLCSHSLTWVRSPLIWAISLLTLSLAVSRYNNLQTRPDTCKATSVRNKTKFSAKATFSYWFDDFDSVTNQLERVSGLCQTSSTPRHHPRSCLQKSCPQACHMSTTAAHSLVKCFGVVARLNTAVTVPILLLVFTCVQSRLLHQG